MTNYNRFIGRTVRIIRGAFAGQIGRVTGDTGETCIVVIEGMTERFLVVWEDVELVIEPLRGAQQEEKLS